MFIGGVHDMAALTASIRHQARSIAEVVRDHMSQRSYLLFLAFVWIALVYIIVAFTDVTAGSFVGSISDESGGVGGGAIATSSLLYLVLPIIMGLLLRYTRLSLNVATLIFLPLVGVAIWVGQYIPFDVASLAGVSEGTGPQDVGRGLAHLLPGGGRGAGVAAVAAARPSGRILPVFRPGRRCLGPGLGRQARSSIRPSAAGA